jgi:hypothetical protein
MRCREDGEIDPRPPKLANGLRREEKSCWVIKKFKYLKGTCLLEDNFVKKIRSHDVVSKGRQRRHHNTTYHAIPSQLYLEKNKSLCS